MHTQSHKHRQTNALLHTQAWFECLLFSFLWQPHKLVIAFCFEDNFPSWNGGISAVSFSLPLVCVSNFHFSFFLYFLSFFLSFFSPLLFPSLFSSWRCLEVIQRSCQYRQVVQNPWGSFSISSLASLFTLLSLCPLYLSLSLSLCITRLFGRQNHAGSLCSICTVHLDGIVC